jgi:hypothetical protein
VDDARLTSIVSRVDDILCAGLFPYGQQVREREGVHAEDSQAIRDAIALLRDAKHELHPNTKGGVNVEPAQERLREALAALERVDTDRLDDVMEDRVVESKRLLGEAIGDV